eukprot:228706-Prymnesium_polylepis.2
MYGAKVGIGTSAYASKSSKLQKSARTQVPGHRARLPCAATRARRVPKCVGRSSGGSLGCLGACTGEARAAGARTGGVVFVCRRSRQFFAQLHVVWVVRPRDAIARRVVASSVCRTVCILQRVELQRAALQQ